jgi:hypothetical protein
MDQVGIEPGGGVLGVPASHFRRPRLPVVEQRDWVGVRSRGGDSGSNDKAVIRLAKVRLGSGTPDVITNALRSE